MAEVSRPPWALGRQASLLEQVGHAPAGLAAYGFVPRPERQIVSISQREHQTALNAESSVQRIMQVNVERLRRKWATLVDADSTTAFSAAQDRIGQSQVVPVVRD